MMAGVTTTPAVLARQRRAARVLVQVLAALGVEDVVLAPGSRSAPLALRARGRGPAGRPASPAPPSLRLHVRRRRAVGRVPRARLAHARVRATAPAPAARLPPRPVAVVTTSGTAVANLHPAVLEAHHSGLPLIVVLTADRPHELRGTGANQTTDQVGIFGAAVRLAVDVPAPDGLPDEARGVRRTVVARCRRRDGCALGDPGPVQLDLAFRDPLVPGGAPWPNRPPWA